MQNNYFFRTLVVSFSLILYSMTIQAQHQQLIMGRSLNAFPETMSVLQDEIKKAGYSISRVQRVDIGLTGMGFPTDKYRVVFFGKSEEIIRLANQYPLLVPYLPLAIAIFAEGDETLLTAMSPSFLAHTYVKENPALEPIFKRWEKDIRHIIEQVSHQE